MFQYSDRLSSRMPGEGLPSVSVAQVLVGLLNQFINNFVFLFPHEPLPLGFIMKIIIIMYCFYSVNTLIHGRICELF